MLAQLPLDVQAGTVAAEGMMGCRTAGMAAEADVGRTGLGATADCKAVDLVGTGIEGQLGSSARVWLVPEGRPLPQSALFAHSYSRPYSNAHSSRR